MAPTDIVVWIGVIATIVCAVYAVLGYYRSPGAAMDSRADPSAPRRRPWVPIICVALADSVDGEKRANYISQKQQVPYEAAQAQREIRTRSLCE